MGDAGDAEPPDLRRMFEEFGETTSARAPLYARLARGIAPDADLRGMLDAAPPTQRQPVLLFAAVHFLLLRDGDEPLAQWYPNLAAVPAAGNPLPAWRDLCHRRRDELVALLASRSTQTNEIGRCALLLPVLGRLGEEQGPLGHVDVGTSAGLNLLLGDYGYRYRPGGEIALDAPVVLECGVRGPAPIPQRIPDVAVAIGLDRAPIDVTNDDAARWLEACVWPDQRDRFERLRTAVGMARAKPVGGHDVRIGDAVTDTPGLVREVASRNVHPVVTNSWVLNYLTTAQRRAYVGALDALGRELDLSWVYAESPALVPGLPRPSWGADQDVTVLTVVRWRAGRRDVEHVARCHPHGYWLHWRH